MALRPGRFAMIAVRIHRFVTAGLALAALLASPAPALAYGGPGSVITGIGALLAVVATLFAALFGFVWFPLKRLYRKVRGGPDDAGEMPHAS